MRSKDRWSRSWFVVLALMLSLSVFAAPGDEDSASSQPKASSDAATYAALMGTSETEAARRLELQKLVGDLEEKLRKASNDIFAGLWIEHQPEFAVEIRFTDVHRGRDLVAAMTKELPAGTVVRVDGAEASLGELEALQEKAVLEARKAGITMDADIDVRTNRVELLTTDVANSESALGVLTAENAGQVRLIAVSELAQPAQLQPLRGGRLLWDCTSAFTVRQTSTGALGVLTAAHCQNTQTYQDTWQTLAFGGENYSGSRDVQWNQKACNMTVPNEFDAGDGIRQVTGTRTRDQQVVGSVVCKNGWTTGKTCGTITSKSICPSYVPSCSSTFIRVRELASGNMCLPGDSGGPFYVENLAYGITSGYYPSNGDCIYTAINYISNLGVTVLTYSGGTGYISSTVNCYGGHYGSNQIDCYASAAGGVAPYSYFWSYFGDATSWGSSDSWAWASYDWPGCPDGGYSSFYVQVTDSCGQVGGNYAEATCTSTCPPYEFCYPY